MRMTTLTSAAAALAFAALAWAADDDRVDLEVTLEGIHSTDGKVLVALHRRTPGVAFPGDAGVVASKRRSADTEPVVIRFADLLPGDYAVAAFHDADGDGELNTNIAGAPTEGYGFSNDARGFMGPPSFEAAAVSIGPDDAPHRVVVRIQCPESSK